MSRWLNLSILLVICGLIGIGGVSLTLGSRANPADDTAQIIFKTYLNSIQDGNEMGGVEVTIKDDHEKNNKCTANDKTNTASTAEAGDIKGRVTFTCPLADKGNNDNKDRSYKYTFKQATRAGYTLSPGPHVPGQTTITVDSSRNKVNTVRLVFTKDPDAPPRVPETKGKLGSIDMRVIDENKKPLGGVFIEVGPDSSGSNAPCNADGSISSGATSAIKDGSREGMLRIVCPAAANGESRRYAVTKVEKAGYSISPSSDHQLSGESALFNINPDPEPLDSSKVKDFTIVMRNNAAPVDNSSQGSNTGPKTDVGDVDNNSNTATVVFVAREGSTDGPVLGGVDITVGDGHENNKKDCLTTGNDKNKGATAPSGDIKGRLTFSCPLAEKATDSNPNRSREYMFVSATKSGYTLSAVPHPAMSKFTVDNKNNMNNVINIVLNKNADGSSAPSGGGGAPNGGSTPSTSSGAPKASEDHPASEMTGSVQVTVYRLKEDGRRDRVSDVSVHIQSVGYPTGDKKNGCANHNEDTKPASAGGKEGQVHFNGCWAGSTDNGKKYQLSFTKFPAGLIFKSFEITGPAGAKFGSGDKSNTENINEQFPVYKNKDGSNSKETQLVLTLMSATQAELQATNVRQVMTQDGLRFEAANDSAKAQAEAKFLNQCVSDGNVTLDDLLSCTDDDGEQPEPCEKDEVIVNDECVHVPTPPTKPTNFKAVQNAAGAIELSWGASTGNPADEEVSYVVERSIKGSDGSGEEPELAGGEDAPDSTTALNMIDPPANLVFPQTYIYSIVAIDEYAEDQGAVLVEITTTKPPANVKTANSATSEEEEEEAETTLTTNDGSAGAAIASTAVSEDLACDVSDADATGYDLLTALGAPVNGSIYSMMCTDEDGEYYEEFEEDFDFWLEFDDEEFDDEELYGFDGEDWELIEFDEDDEATAEGNLGFGKAKRTDGDGKTRFTVSGKKPIALALVNKRQTAPNVIVPVSTLLLLVVAVVAGRTIIRRRLTSSYSPYPYGDVDLRPIHAERAVSGEAKTEKHDAAQPINPYLIDPDPAHKKDDNET